MPGATPWGSEFLVNRRSAEPLGRERADQREIAVPGASVHPHLVVGRVGVDEHRSAVCATDAVEKRVPAMIARKHAIRSRPAAKVLRLVFMYQRLAPA